MNKAPNEASNCGNIANTPIDWNILLLSSAYCAGEAFVSINVNIKATVDDIPIATVPGILVNVDTSIATKAIARDGINIFSPSFSAFN